VSKLDIWEILGKIDAHDMSYYSKLPADKKAGFVPIVTLRWLSGSGDKAQLLTLNEVVNPLAFSLYKYPDLLYKLMVIATPCKKKDYKWISQKKADKAVSKISDILIRYFECSPREAKEFAVLYTPTDILDMAHGLGETKEYIKSLKDELQKR
jgi:hypothetical protein